MIPDESADSHQPTAMDLTEDEFRRSLHDHVIERATRARLKYGLYIDEETVRQMLGDPEVVRYPTTVTFDAAPLQDHEFAYAQPLGFHPSDGFVLCIHPHFRHQPENLPLLVAYHIPVINYGSVIDPQAAETFGATLLGLDRDTYYHALCELTDSIPRDE